MRRDVMMFSAVPTPWVEATPLPARSIAKAEATLSEAPARRPHHFVQAMPAFELVVRPRS